MTRRRASRDERRLILEHKIHVFLVAGWRVESESEYRAVVVYGRGVSPLLHIVHFLLTMGTVGLWIFVWGAHILGARMKRRLLTVDEYGDVDVHVARSS